MPPWHRRHVIVQIPALCSNGESGGTSRRTRTSAHPEAATGEARPTQIERKSALAHRMAADHMLLQQQQQDEQNSGALEQLLSKTLA